MLFQAERKGAIIVSNDKTGVEVGDRKVAEVLGVPSFEQNVGRITDRIVELLIAKNKQYSNSALDPILVFSKAGRVLAPTEYVPAPAPPRPVKNGGMGMGRR